MKKSVLVTGASSGIGLATANLLAASGYRVFAGMRRVPDVPGGPGAPEPIVLDVTQPASIAAARTQIDALLNGDELFALVNNAGIGDLQPLEYVPLEEFKAVFEVDVFGVVAVTQAFLPLLRRSRGRIVNISSVGGLLGLPFGASLCASKHAIEAISDALRMELWSAGIRVTILQPASINSGAAEKIAEQVDRLIARMQPEASARYGAMLRHAVKTMIPQEKNGSPPSVVAEAILSILRAKRPPIRRLTGKDGTLINFVARFLPSFLRDAIIRRALLGNPPFGG